MSRKECRHALDCLVADGFAIRQASSTRHSAPNALLARFLRGQAAFAMFLAQF